MLKYYLSVVVGVVIISALISPACALIKVELTVEKVYKGSQAVVPGKITEVAADSRVLSVELGTALKGKAPGPKIRVQIAAPAELIKDAAANQPIVLIMNNPNEGLIHVADTWLLATSVPNSNMLVWRTVQVKEDLKPSFPGRTSALVKLVTDMNAGNDSIINDWKHKPFAGGVKKRGKLAVQKPSWILASDVNGDKKPDLLVGSGAGTKLFLAQGDNFEDGSASAGAWGNAGDYHASGDVDGDGKADVLLDGTLWLNQGGKFAAAKSTLELPKGTPLTAALLDVNGDQKLDALLASASGELRVFENPGAADKPWTARPAKTLWNGEASFATFGDFGDTGKPHVLAIASGAIMRYAIDADGGPPADFSRLTGIDLKKFEKFKDGFKNVQAVAVQMDEETGIDLLITGATGSLLLVNRGLGAFFVDETSHNNLTANGAQPLPVAPSAASPWTRADQHGKGVDDVLLLGEDGSLYELSNSAR
ncbi:MAG TPA: VCBS repeat-containing protein [Planctomycetota bacterium]|nr:VCBS repeat-containing protein [Planctomycetota bacterium]